MPGRQMQWRRMPWGQMPRIPTGARLRQTDAVETDFMVTDVRAKVDKADRSPDRQDTVTPDKWYR